MSTLGRLFKPGFLRNVLVMSGGTVLSQALVSLSSPVLTRLYTPSEFGAFATFNSILAITAVAASLRYDFAIPLPKEEKHAKALLMLSLMLVTSVSFLLALGLWFGADFLTDYFELPFDRYGWLLPLGVFGIGAYQALNYWSTRRQQFKLLSATKLWQSVCQVGLQIAGGVLGYGVAGLFGGYVLGRAAGSGALLRQAELLPLAPLKTVWQQARRYVKFPLYYAPAAFVNIVGLEFPILIFKQVFGVDVAGLFSFTVRILTQPIFLIGQATGQVFYPKAAELSESPEATKAFVERTAAALLLISVPLFGFVALAGPELFSLVFGEEWRRSGLYARYLAPWFMCSLIVGPLITFVLVKERQRLSLIINVVETSLRLGVLWLGGRYFNADISVMLYSAVGVSVALFNLVWVLRLAGSGFFEWLRPLRGYLYGIVSVLALMMMLTFYAPPLIAAGVQLAGLAAFAYWSLRFYLRTYEV